MALWEALLLRTDTALMRRMQSSLEEFLGLLLGVRQLG